MVTHSLNVHILKIQCITHTHTHTHTPQVVYQGNETGEKIFENGKVFKEDLKESTGRMADRNGELVPDSWSLVKERAPTTGFLLLLLQGWYSKHLGVCKNKQKHTGFNRTTLNMHKCSGYTPSSSIGVGACPTPSKNVGMSAYFVSMSSVSIKSIGTSSANNIPVMVECSGSDDGRFWTSSQGCASL